MNEFVEAQIELQKQYGVDVKHQKEVDESINDILYDEMKINEIIED